MSQQTIILNKNLSTFNSESSVRVQTHTIMDAPKKFPPIGLYKNLAPIPCVLSANPNSWLGNHKSSLTSDDEAEMSDIDEMLYSPDEMSSEDEDEDEAEDTESRQLVATAPSEPDESEYDSDDSLS